ncbi:MAG: hypothetical protein V4574_02535 [Pseudomonadota bacterium]
MRAAVRAELVAARGRSLATARSWRAGPEYRALVAAFADCPLDHAGPAARRAARLFADAGWAAALLAPLVDALAADRFFEPPFRFSRDGPRTGAVIFDCPAVSITASVLNAAALRGLPPPATIVFSGRVTVTRYEKAGGATLRRWRGLEAVTPLPPLALADGEVRVTDGRTQAQLLDGARSDLVMLAATIRAGAAPLIREHCIADGALVRVGSADEGASRTEMLLAFLRRAGRADAGPCFAAASRDPAFHTRWAAMREWLALDARAALPRLAEMADGDPEAEIRAAAASTLVTVRTRIEAACPA